MVTIGLACLLANGPRERVADLPLSRDSGIANTIMTGPWWTVMLPWWILGIGGSQETANTSAG